jgi:hypothetical protein
MCLGQGIILLSNPVNSLLVISLLVSHETLQKMQIYRPEMNRGKLGQTIPQRKQRKPEPPDTLYITWLPA